LQWFAAPGVTFALAFAHHEASVVNAPDLHFGDHLPVVAITR
jgi:hypothetical protein